MGFWLGVAWGTRSGSSPRSDESRAGADEAAETAEAACTLGQGRGYGQCAARETPVHTHYCVPDNVSFLFTVLTTLPSIFQVRVSGCQSSWVRELWSIPQAITQPIPTTRPRCRRQGRRPGCRQERRQDRRQSRRQSRRQDCSKFAGKIAGMIAGRLAHGVRVEVARCVRGDSDGLALRRGVCGRG